MLKSSENNSHMSCSSFDRTGLPTSRDNLVKAVNISYYCIKIRIVWHIHYEDFFNYLSQPCYPIVGGKIHLATGKKGNTTGACNVGHVFSGC